MRSGKSRSLRCNNNLFQKQTNEQPLLYINRCEHGENNYFLNMATKIKKNIVFIC